MQKQSVKSGNNETQHVGWVHIFNMCGAAFAFWFQTKVESQRDAFAIWLIAMWILISTLYSLNRRGGSCDATFSVWNAMRFCTSQAGLFWVFLCVVLGLLVHGTGAQETRGSPRRVFKTIQQAAAEAEEKLKQQSEVSMATVGQALRASAGHFKTSGQYLEPISARVRGETVRVTLGPEGERKVEVVPAAADEATASPPEPIDPSVVVATGLKPEECVVDEQVGMVNIAYPDASDREFRAFANHSDRAVAQFVDTRLPLSIKNEAHFDNVEFYSFGGVHTVSFSAQLMGLHYDLKASQFPVHYDTGCKHTIFPRELLTRPNPVLKLTRDEQGRNESVRYPYTQAISMEPVNVTFVNGGLDLYKRAFVWDEDFIVVGSNWLCTIGQLPLYHYPQGSWGPKYLLDTGSSVNVAPYAERSGYLKHPVCLNRAIVSGITTRDGYAFLTPVDGPSDFILSTNIAGIKNWRPSRIGADDLSDVESGLANTDAGGAFERHICMGDNLSSKSKPAAGKKTTKQGKKPVTNGATVQQSVSYPKKSATAEDIKLARKEQRDNFNKLYRTETEKGTEFRREIKKLSDKVEDLARAKSESLRSGTGKDFGKFIERKSNALRNSLKQIDTNAFTADNFGANNFGAASYEDVSRTLSFHGMPAQTADACHEMFQKYVKGDGKALCKRFGGRNSSTIMVTNAEKTVNMTGGPSTLVSGNTVYVVVPISNANRGAFILQRASGDVIPTVIDYVSPTQDVEKLSYMHAVMGATLSVCAPTVLGGTTTQVANVLLELGHVLINPTCIDAGRLSGASAADEIKQEVMGAKTETMRVVTYGFPDTTVLRYTGFDQTAGTLVRANNTALVVNSSLYPSVSNTAFFQCASGASGYQAAGWLVNPSGLSLPIGTQTTVWQFSTCADYVRHLWYGDFRLQQLWQWSPSAAVAGDFVETIATVYYSDGTNSQLSARNYSQIFGYNTQNLTWDSRSNSALAAKRGVLVTDIIVTVRAAGASVNWTGGTGNQSPFVSLEWFDIPANTTYMAAVMKGVSPVANVGVKLMITTEVFPDKVGSTGLFVPATESPPGDPHTISQYLSVAEAHGIYKSGALIFDKEANSQERFGASAFGDFLSGAWRKIKPIAVPLAKHGVQMLAQRYAPTGSMHATCFGDGARKPVFHTGVYFPIVEEGESAEITGVNIEVLIGGLTKYPFAPNMYVEAPDYHGTSDQLAFFVAMLKQSGAPAARGVYTGQVQAMDIDAVTKLAYVTIEPVRAIISKAVVAQKTDRLRGVFVEGYVCDGDLTDTMPVHFFGPAIETTVLSTPLISDDSRFPEGARRTHLRLNW